VLGRFRQKKLLKTLFSGLVALSLVLSIASCGDRIPSAKTFGIAANALAEVAPPEIISQLRQKASKYQPRVKIVTPKSDRVLDDTDVSVKFQVEGLPIFKDPDLGLGSHLNVTLDNLPYQEVYQLEEPLVLENLSPGTHTVRVLANTAWNESFKNPEAYAQTTFHVLTKSTDNLPLNDKGSIAYNSPQGSYSAQPLLLDFYVNQTRKTDSSRQIRVTINGESFNLDNPESIYLEGFKSGKNWIKLELLDNDGKPITNIDRETLGVVNYEPNAESSLSKLLAGNIPIAQGLKLVDPNYEPPAEAIETPEPTPIVEPSATPITPESDTETPENLQPIAPPVEIIPSLPIEPEAPKSEKLEETLPEDSQPIEPIRTPILENTPNPEIIPESTPEPQPSPKGGFFQRFRREQTKSVESASPPPVLVTPSPTPTPEVISTPTLEPSPQVETTPELTPEPSSQVETTPETTTTPQPEPTASPTGGFFQRFRRSVDKSSSGNLPAPVVEESSPEPTIEPIPTPTVTTTPEAIAPEVESTPVPSFLERFRKPTPKVEVSPTPTVTTAPEAIAPEVESIPVPSFLERFRKPTPKVEVSPTPTVTTAPEVEETPGLSLIERLKRRSTSTPNTEISPTPTVIEQPKAIAEPKAIATPSLPIIQPSPKLISPQDIPSSETKPETDRVNASKNLFRGFFPSSKTSSKLENKPSTTEVKTEKIPLVQASPETIIPSRYLRQSDNGSRDSATESIDE
jgi:hypothetical protein